jgi:hypothetical protein
MGALRRLLPHRHRRHHRRYAPCLPVTSQRAVAEVPLPL